MLDPVMGYRDELRRKGVEPKNHHKDNLRKMRELQNKNRIKKQAELNKPGPQKSKLTARAKSKFMDKANAKSENAKKHVFLKRSSSSNNSTVAPSEAGASTVRERARNSKPTVPLRTQQGKLKRPAGKRDYLAENRAQAKEAPKKFSEKAAAKKFTDKNCYGRVPEYILQRKLEMLQKVEQDKIAAEQAKIPAGMRVMSEEERLETLGILKGNAKKVEGALAKLPLRVELPSMVKKEKTLRAKLQEIEDAIQIFNKKTVFVSLDE